MASRVELDHSVAELDALISDVHNLSHRLHSSKLEHLGLKAAMKDLCQEMAKRHGLQINLEAQIAQDGLSGNVPLCFYRVAQEALSNVVKHSDATRAHEPDSGTGSATNAGAGLGTRIQDWGGSCRTWIYSDARASSQHWGEIVHQSKPGEGTVVTAEAPVPTSNGFNAGHSAIGSRE